MDYLRLFFEVWVALNVIFTWRDVERLQNELASVHGQLNALRQRGW